MKLTKQAHFLWFQNSPPDAPEENWMVERVERSTEVKERNTRQFNFGQQIVHDTQYCGLHAMALSIGRLLNFQKLVVR